MKRCILLSTLVGILVVQAAFGQISSPSDSSLGSLDFSISCTSETRPVFNHAVMLLHHMTYPRARAEFEAVARMDAQCAMAYWGIAMTLFQPLWPTRPGLGERLEGWAAVQKAEALAAPTRREHLFIAAADSFFRNPESEDYWTRIRRWARASKLVYRDNPSDDEAAAFYALSLLATAPAGGRSLDNQKTAANILLAINAKNPSHPASFHYLIHANDVQGREHESLDLVRHYADIAPDNPHALHMPTHIFTRLGNWDAVIDGNLRAAEAALRYPAGPQAQYVWDEFPHSLEYLVYAYLQQGNDSAAAVQIQRLRSTGNLHPTFKTAFHVSSIPARFALERKAWEEAAELVPRPLAGLDWDRFPWPEAITWFARGIGASQLGMKVETEEALARLQELEDATFSAGEELFARQIRILRLGASAWVSQANGRAEDAIVSVRAAGRLEASTPKPPLTPAPTLPAEELLGEIFLKQDQPDSALAAFQRSLTRHPRRFNGLLGAAHAAVASGDDALAREYYAELESVGDPTSKRTGYVEAAQFLAFPPEQY